MHVYMDFTGDNIKHYADRLCLMRMENAWEITYQKERMRSFSL